MKQATRGWLDKAEGDYTVAQREIGVAAPVFDAFCFHAQQCAEKHLNALLQEQDIAFPRTHDLVALAALAAAVAPTIRGRQADLTTLTTAAVDLRYPGATASRADAESALRVAGAVRSLLRASLGLPTP